MAAGNNGRPVGRPCVMRLGLFGLTTLLVFVAGIWAVGPYRDLRGLRDRQIAQRVVDFHATGCIVAAATGGEGWIDVDCRDGRRFRLYAPLSCERYSLACDLAGIDAACWELDAY